VLVNDTLRAARQEKRKMPLRPVRQPPLQQAMHIHVFWRPVTGAMVKESSVTNAIVHWYVFNGEASGGSDMVHYQGAAFVKLYPKGEGAEVTIGDGSLAPQQVRGAMTDPMGPSRITGTILAVRNDARVKELLAGLREKATGSERLWTEAEAEAESGPVFGR
jgi:hypothetical protein